MYKIAMIADLHHFSETLSDGGKAYRLRSSSDQKCLAESGAIITSAFGKLAESDCDAVLIAGDISNDGERVSHEEMLRMLEELRKKKPVYVVYATHDWCCDGNAKRFKDDKFYNDVETVTPPMLRGLYRNYGESSSYDVYETHLGAVSYAAELGDDICLLGLNDDQDGNGHSGYTDDHFGWIIKNITEAKNKGKTVIVMEHHLVLPSVSMFKGTGVMIGNSEKRAEKLAEAGCDFIIAGHSHMQRTVEYTAKNGNTMRQINVGALCGHPSPIVTLTLTDDEYAIDVERLDRFSYKGDIYTNTYITNHTKDLLMGLIKSGINDKQEFIDRASALDESIKPEKVKKLYPVFKKLCKFVLGLTVGNAAKLINAAAMGNVINKDAVKKIKNDNLLNYIMEFYLTFFDGSKKYEKDDPVSIILKDLLRLPERFAKIYHIKALKDEKFTELINKIEATAEEIIDPPYPSNKSCVIKR